MLSKSTNILSKKTVAFIILAVFFVLADRFLKALCLNGFFDRPIPIFGDIFTLNFVKNYYIAFSIPFSGPILTAIIGIIIFILLIYWLKLFFSFKLSAQRSAALAPISGAIFPLTILILGAILNFTDRILYGYVIDYFSLQFFTVFNLADIMIVFSIIWMIFTNRRK
ncbi:MAG: signal peptidase II [Patescibacteria group bacterium]|nr:signal peptidase II [Patescibacteria group bacterium]